MLVGSTTLSFAQTKSAKKVAQKPNIEVVLNQQVEILNARIDSMTIAHQQALDKVLSEMKDNCTSYYDRLDNEMDRTFSKFSWIIGLLGVLIPIIVNRVYERSLKKDINDQNKKYEQKFTEHKEYIDRISNEVRNYEKRSKINSLLSEAQNILKKSPDEAIKIYTEILNMDKDNRDALLWRGITYFLVNKSEKALLDLSKLTKIEPRHARAFNNIGNVYANASQYKSALKHYNTALKINPQYAAVYSNIALLYIDQEKYLKALEFCNKALTLDDEMIKTHKQKISIYVKLAKLSKDEETRQKYIDKIKQEHVIVNMLKDKYLSELMSL